MFRRLPDDRRAAVSVTEDGRPCAARKGDTVAAVLLAENALPMRVSTVSGAPRAAYCMMGACFECLVTVDGVANRQGCLVAVAEGMVIATQTAMREAGR